MIDQSNELIKTATKDYYEKVEQSKETIIELAIHTAEKILHSHLNEAPEAFIPVIEAAVTEIKTDKEIIIYTHPNQFDFLIKQKEELRNSVDGGVNLAIYIDKELPAHGCRIEHPFGQVDASIDTQLEQIRTVLHNINNGE